MQSKLGFFLLTIIVLIADQWTKHWAQTSLKPVVLIEVIPGLFRFTYATNRGVAFSLFADSELNVPMIFASISIIAALVVLFYLSRAPAGKLRMKTALSLLLAGIIGNLIDRLRFGEVVDFLDFHLGELFTWPTFNIADAAICIGAVLLALEMLREERSAKLKAPVATPVHEERGAGSPE
jgi:signal peptidase II